MLLPAWCGCLWVGCCPQGLTLPPLALRVGPVTHSIGSPARRAEAEAPVRQEGVLGGGYCAFQGGYSRGWQGTDIALGVSWLGEDKDVVLCNGALVTVRIGASGGYHARVLGRSGELGKLHL